MNSHAELKELAESAKRISGEYWCPMDNLQSMGHPEERAAFIAAASPDKVLVLLAENERLRGALEKIGAYIDKSASAYLERSGS